MSLLYSKILMSPNCLEKSYSVIMTEYQKNESLKHIFSQDFEWAKINLSIFAKQITKKTVNLTYKIALYDYHLLQIDIQPKIVLSRISYTFVEIIREYILNRFSSEKYNLNIALKSKNVLTYISNFYDVIMNKQIFLILFFASEFYHFDGVKYEKWNVSPKFRRAKIKSKKEIIKMQKTFLKFKSY